MTPDELIEEYNKYTAADYHQAGDRMWLMTTEEILQEWKTFTADEIFDAVDGMSDPDKLMTPHELMVEWASCDPQKILDAVDGYHDEVKQLPRTMDEIVAEWEKLSPTFGMTAYEGDNE